jgi:ABC-type multidrug transport system fused ATPase/permease subunit
MPLGLDTLVTEGGSQLSGGQRQRVMVPAHWSVDLACLLRPGNQRPRQPYPGDRRESLAAMNATRIIIAHRLSTIRSADRIVVLENGRIAETGTYDELVDREGAFRRLVQRQLL